MLWGAVLPQSIKTRVKFFDHEVYSMKQQILILAVLALVPGLVMAQAANGGAGKPAKACEKQQAQCMKQCDKEKSFWFFKGEAYGDCASKCEARMTSCMATGVGAADQMRGRAMDDADEDRREAAEDRREERREMAEERHETMEDAAEDRHEAMEEQAEERGEVMQEAAEEEREAREEAAEDRREAAEERMEERREAAESHARGGKGKGKQRGDEDDEGGD